MTKKSLLILFAGLLFACFTLQAQRTLTLSSAIDLALKENRKIQNAQYDVVIAKKQVWETTAIGLPQVKADLGYQNMLDLPTSLLPAMMFNPAAGPDDYIAVQFGQQHNASFDFQVSQLLFSGEYIVGLQASKTFQELSQKALIKSETDVIELVSQSYYTVLMAQANMMVMQNTLKDIQKLYDDLQKLYAAGMVEETEAQQIEINLKTIQNSISTLERQIPIAKNILKYQIGIDLSEQITLSESLEALFKSTAFEGSLSTNFDINKNIDYQMLQTQLEISKLSLKREKSTFLPSLSAFYSHSVSGQTNNFDDYFSGNQPYYLSNIVGVGLSWNLFNSGSKYVKTQQAQLEVDKLENTDYMLQQQLEFGVLQARAELQNAYDTYIKTEKSMQLAKNIYDRGLIKFVNGLMSSTDITQINMQYFNSQSDYYSSMLKVLHAKTALDKILGNNIK